VLDENAAPHRKEAQQSPPHFTAMSIVAKRSPISATAELFNDIGTSFFSVRGRDA